MNFKFIVLEGIDCCGKTTVSKILQEKLQPSTRIAFPDRTTEIGTLLNRFLKKEIKFSPIEVHLLYSANRYEKASFIEETLKSSNVICDRYWLSGAVYSAAKGLDFDWCKEIDKALPKPDFTFFIDADPIITAQRSTFGEEAHDKIEFQSEVYRIYKERVNNENLIVLDGKLTPDQIAENILNYLRQNNQ